MPVPSAASSATSITAVSARSTNGPAICGQGDSGGPVYQRTPTAGEVQAIGLITLSNDTENVCSRTLLNSVMGPTNTRLDTDAAG
jgi:secreted trypsin-like serine protease